MKGSSPGFGELKKLRQTLVRTRAQARQEEAESARLRQQVASPRAEDAQLFRRAMQAVTPLKQPDCIGATPPGAAAPSAGQLAKRRAALGEPRAKPAAPLSDQFSPCLNTAAGMAWMAPDMAADTTHRLQLGHWPVQARIDLHGMRLDTAREALFVFLDDCLAHRLRCIHVIHGKGYGSTGGEAVLREKAPVWLMQHSGVCAFTQAPSARGGAGALLALLRRAR